MRQPKTCLVLGAVLGPMRLITAAVKSGSYLGMLAPFVLTPFVPAPFILLGILACGPGRTGAEWFVSF